MSKRQSRPKNNRAFSSTSHEGSCHSQKHAQHAATKSSKKNTLRLSSQKHASARSLRLSSIKILLQVIASSIRKVAAPTERTTVQIYTKYVQRACSKLKLT